MRWCLRIDAQLQPCNARGLLIRASRQRFAIADEERAWTDDSTSGAQFASEVLAVLAFLGQRINYSPPAPSMCCSRRIILRWVDDQPSPPARNGEPSVVTHIAQPGCRRRVSTPESLSYYRVRIKASSPRAARSVSVCLLVLASAAVNPFLPHRISFVPRNCPAGPAMARAYDRTSAAVGTRACHISADRRVMALTR